MQKKIKVMLIEDDLDFVYLIRKIIENDDELSFVGFVNNKSDALSMAKKTEPDIVIVDLCLSKSELDGVDAARDVRLNTDAKVLLLTSFEQHDIIINASKRAFASGYIFKSHSHVLSEMIKNTHNSSTPQAHLIKELFLNDFSYAERSIVNMLLGDTLVPQSATKTIANQKTSIFKKSGLKNTNELLHILRTW